MLFFNTFFKIWNTPPYGFFQKITKPFHPPRIFFSKTILYMDASFRQIYTNDVDALLEKLRVNCILFSKAHKKRYLQLEQSLKYYKLPIIVISGISSLISVSQEYMPQYYITILNSVFGLSCGIICSIELYLGISVQLAKAATLTKEFYSLAIEIYKVLSMDTIHRNENAVTFLESVFGRYSALHENKDIVAFHIQDQLIPLPADISTQLGSRRSINSVVNAPAPPNSVASSISIDVV